MKRRKPNERFLAIKAADAPTGDVMEAELWNLLHGRYADPHVEWAYDIYKNIIERETLNAFLLAEATDVTIHSTLNVPPVVMAIYRHLFFDMKAFRDKLQLFSWVKEYEVEERGTPYGSSLFQKALTGGVLSLVWTFSHGSIEIDVNDIQRQIMIDAYFKGQTNRLFAVNSKEARAAQSFMALALKAAASQVKKEDLSGYETIVLKLLHRDETKPVEALPPAERPMN